MRTRVCFRYFLKLFKECFFLSLNLYGWSVQTLTMMSPLSSHSVLQVINQTIIHPTEELHTSEWLLHREGNAPPPRLVFSACLSQGTSIYMSTEVLLSCSAGCPTRFHSFQWCHNYVTTCGLISSVSFPSCMYLCTYFLKVGASILFLFLVILHPFNLIHHDPT